MSLKLSRFVAAAIDLFDGRKRRGVTLKTHKPEMVEA